MPVDPNTWEPGYEGDFFKTAQCRIDRFFRSRKSEGTREYAWAILDFLSEKRHQDFEIGLEREDVSGEDIDLKKQWAWFRSRDIISSLVPQKIPHEITVFRLLDALVEEKLIEKRIDTEYIGKGKKPVYYRLYIGFLLPYWAMSRERLIQEIDELNNSYSQRKLRYDIAVGILKKHYEDPELLIEKRYSEIKIEIRERQRKYIMEQQAQGLTKPDLDIEKVLDMMKFP